MSKGIVFRNINNENVYPCGYYPVGSIYLSLNDLDPSTYFGGEWEQIKDRFLLTSGDTYKAGNTGGEATHVLTINEMPSHSHPIGYRTNTNITVGSTGQWTTDPGTSQNWNSEAGCIKNTGGSQPHNNMPPYLVVYAWKRIA